jgi:SAM-dependent methyltransferase
VRPGEPETLEPTCRVCGAPEAEPFFRLHAVPVQDGLLWPSRDAALAAPSGNIELVFCGSCGYIGNRAFDPGKLRYDPTYDISLHHSPVYETFIGQLVERLAASYDLPGKTVLEIGCGKGDFLRALCLRAGSRGLGFDPTSTASEQPDGPIRIRRDFYSERYSDEPADLLCCRHVLNSIADLQGFLGSIRRTLGPRTGTALYFEVPDGSVVFRRRVVWNVVYEHCSFFTPVSLARLFRETGFVVRNVAPCFLDEYLGIEAHPDGGRTEGRTDVGDITDLEAEVGEFGALYRDTTGRWSGWLAELRARGRTAVLWGAGARAVAFLSALRPGPEIPRLVDINPHRQGLFMPVTGQGVAAPATLAQDPPDAVLITNPAFESEIRGQAAALGFRGDVRVLD